MTLFQKPEPIKYDNPVDIYTFGIPKTKDEMLYENLVPADDYTTLCRVKDCSQRIWGRTPLCERHAYDMWLKIEVEKKLEAEHERHRIQTEAAKARYDDLQEQKRMEQEALKAEWRRQAEEEERIMRSKNRPGMIYYLRVGALIKIGFSSYLDERLRAYPPDSKVLAVHPGTPEVERQVHNKFFNHLSHGREWFTPSPEIEQHIKAIHEQYPDHNKI